MDLDHIKARAAALDALDGSGNCMGYAELLDRALADTEALRANVLALHSESMEGEIAWCSECQMNYPCRTVRVVIRMSTLDGFEHSHTKGYCAGGTYYHPDDGGIPSGPCPCPPGATDDEGYMYEPPVPPLCFVWDQGAHREGSAHICRVIGSHANHECWICGAYTENSTYPLGNQ